MFLYLPGVGVKRLEFMSYSKRRHRTFRPQRWSRLKYVISIYYIINKLDTTRWKAVTNRQTDGQLIDQEMVDKRLIKQINNVNRNPWYPGRPCNEIDRILCKSVIKKVMYKKNTDCCLFSYHRYFFWCKRYNTIFI